jgi:hypothetical protein
MQFDPNSVVDQVMTADLPGDQLNELTALAESLFEDDADIGVTPDDRYRFAVYVTPDANYPDGVLREISEENRGAGFHEKWAGKHLFPNEVAVFVADPEQLPEGVPSMTDLRRRINEFDASRNPSSFTYLVFVPGGRNSEKLLGDTVSTALGVTLHHEILTPIKEPGSLEPKSMQIFNLVSGTSTEAITAQIRSNEDRRNTGSYRLGFTWTVDTGDISTVSTLSTKDRDFLRALLTQQKFPLWRDGHPRHPGTLPPQEHSRRVHRIGGLNTARSGGISSERQSCEVLIVDTNYERPNRFLLIVHSGHIQASFCR